MKFLLDANLPRSSAPLQRGLGQEVEDVREVLPGGADNNAVAARAQSQKFALVTRDFDFADIRNYPSANYSGMVVLQLPDDVTDGSRPGRRHRFHPAQRAAVESGG